MRPIATLAFLLVLVGGVMFVVGLCMPRLRDEPEFRRKYSLLGPGQSREFHALRAEFETASIPCQDYGLCVIFIGLAVGWGRHWGRIFENLPRRRTSIILVGCGAAAITMLGETGSLFLDADRGQFPWWADSLAIPIAGMPVIFLLLCAWAAISALVVPRSECGGNRALSPTKIVFIALASAPAFLTAAHVIQGIFFYIPATIGWGIFSITLVQSNRTA